MPYFKLYLSQFLNNNFLIINKMSQDKPSMGEVKVNQGKQYRCFCSKNYNSYAGLYLHLKSKHQDAFSKYKNMKISKLLIPVQNQGPKKVFRLKEPLREQNQTKPKSTPEFKKVAANPPIDQRQQGIGNLGYQCSSFPSQSPQFNFRSFYQNSPYQTFLMTDPSVTSNSIGQYGLQSMTPKIQQKPSVQNLQYPLVFNGTQQNNICRYAQNYPISGYYPDVAIPYYPNFPFYLPLPMQKSKNDENKNGLHFQRETVLRNEQEEQKNTLNRNQSHIKPPNLFYSNEEYMKYLSETIANQASFTTKNQTNLNSS